MTARIAQKKDSLLWKAEWEVAKFWGDVTEEEISSGAVLPYEVIRRSGNLVTNGGVSALWGFAIGNGTTTAEQPLTYYSNARATIGVGDSSTAAAATQFDLQAATNKFRQGMEATYPTHTDGTQSITFRSLFATGNANFAWQEWGVFNGTTAAGSSTAASRMLNRKVENLGTKTSAASWQFTVTLSIS